MRFDFREGLFTHPSSLSARRFLSFHESIQEDPVSDDRNKMLRLLNTHRMNHLSVHPHPAPRKFPTKPRFAPRENFLFYFRLPLHRCETSEPHRKSKWTATITKDIGIFERSNLTAFSNLELQFLAQLKCIISFLMYTSVFTNVPQLLILNLKMKSN